MLQNLIYPIGFISYNKQTPLPRKKNPIEQKHAEPSDDSHIIHSERSYEDIVVTDLEDNIPQTIVNTEIEEPAIAEMMKQIINKSAYLYDPEDTEKEEIEENDSNAADVPRRSSRVRQTP